tara:strand:+ start:351 stop:1478 length:1128 start_codon:yes stop_codon:yes gene_type:complete
MPIQTTVMPDNLYMRMNVDGNEFPFALSINIEQKVNSARKLTCSFAGKEALALCRLGAIVEFNFHKTNPKSFLSSTPVYEDDKSFIGIIKSVSPKETISTFTAVDYVTFLAESEFKFYKPSDYVGEDLYFAAAAECDYRGIDVSRLTSGSGIFITEDMPLFGWKTRKEFIDACFNEMRVLINDNEHPPNTIRQWYYAIQKDKTMDFFYPDNQSTGSTAYVALDISENNNNITKGGFISQIDTTQLINAITVVSKSDDTIFSQITSEPSVDQFGVVSKFVSYDSTNKDEIDNIANLLINRFNKPTVSYSIITTDSDHLFLGNLVRVRVPALNRNEILPIIGYKTVLGRELSTFLTIGERELSLSDTIELLKEPTDR